MPDRLAAELGAQRLGRVGVDLERPLVREDDAVRVAGELDRREVVEHVLAHRLGRTVERVAVARGVRLPELDELAGRERDARHLRGQDLLLPGVGVLPARGDEPVPAAEDATRRVGLAVALARVDPVDEEAVAPDDPDPAAPAPGRGRLRAELVLVAADREAEVELLDRVVARVRHQVVDGVHRVLAVTSAVGALVHLEVEPVLAHLLGEPRVRAEVDPGRVPGRHALGERVGEREDRVVDDALHLAEAREARAREGRVVDRPLRRDHLHRPEDAVVLRHVLGERDLVEQDRAHRVVRADEERPLERDVVAGRHLGVRARQVDRDLVALDDHLRLDPQADAAVARVVVEPAGRRLVLAVRQLADLRAQHRLAVVHPVVRGAHHRVHAVALVEPEHPVPPELARGHHRVHVAAVHRLRADVVEDHLVEVLVQLAGLVPAEPVVDLRLGVDVERVGVDPGEGAADVEHVRRHRREPHELALPEDRHRDGDVRAVRGAVVRVVVDDHVALDDLPLEVAHEAADVPGERADVHRRRVRLAELAALRVEDPGAEVLGLADDRRVGHPEQDARHLLRDRVERAAEDAHRDRVDLDPLELRRPRVLPQLVLESRHGHTPSLVVTVAAAATARASAEAPTSITMFPKRSTCASTPGGITVVESYWLTIAGPTRRLPARSASRS